MRILIMAGNYAPEKTASAPLTTDFCQYLTASGHSVSVVTTFPHYPQWKIRNEYAGRFYSRETIDGVSVFRILNYIPRHPTSLKRVLYYGSFGVEAFLPAVASGRPDLIVCVTPPLELALSAFLLKLLWRVPFVLWIKDMVPDVAIQLGMLRNPLLITLARRLEHFAYAHAAKLLVLCPSFRENICRKGVSAPKVAVVSDWVNTERIRPDIPAAGFRQRHSIASNVFLVLHTGNIGAKQHLEFLVRSAKLLEEKKEIQFVIVGDGARKAAVVAEAEQIGANNVRFLPLQSEEHFAEMLAAADILMLHQDASVTDSVIPSKLLAYMAAGRAIIATAARDSATGFAVARSGCGLAVEPENQRALAEAVLKLAANQELRERCGNSARAFVCANFSRLVVLPHLESLLYESAGIPRPAAQKNRSAQPMTGVA
jgi:putative colanic acid biosynthesis glycosyltransferase WcaI